MAYFPALVILDFDTLHSLARQLFRLRLQSAPLRFAPSGDWQNCSAKEGLQDDKGYLCAYYKHVLWQ